MNPRSLKSMLADQLEAKDMTLERLSSETGVPERYLKAMAQNEPDRLPALPYMRKHLLAIADALDIDRDLIVEAYRLEFGSKLSGPADRLPGNRFALQKKGRRWIWIAAAVVAAGLLYAVLDSAFFGMPYFRLVSPPQDAELFEVSDSTLLLAGTTEPNGKLSINGEPAVVQPDGSFEFEFQLEPELNTIEFRVERFLGKTLTVVKKVYVRPADPLIADFSSTSPDFIEPDFASSADSEL